MHRSLKLGTDVVRLTRQNSKATYNYHCQHFRSPDTVVLQLELGRFSSSPTVPEVWGTILAIHYSRTCFVVMECDKHMLLQKIYSVSLTKKSDPLYLFGSFTDPPQLSDTHTRGLWEKKRTRMTYHISASCM